MTEPVLGGDSAERQKLTDALDTIVEVLVGGKLEVVRSSITEMKSELSGRIAEVSEKSTEAADRVVANHLADPLLQGPFAHSNLTGSGTALTPGRVVMAVFFDKGRANNQSEDRAAMIAAT